VRLASSTQSVRAASFIHTGNAQFSPHWDYRALLKDQIRATLRLNLKLRRDVRSMLVNAHTAKEGY